MSDGTNPYTITAHPRIAEIDGAAWDACAGPSNPFVSHGFLAALEESGSVCAKTGWLPQHVTVTDASGVLVACAPLYLKSHSFGEYVFDQGWAEAYERAGGRYYPKMLCAVPFSPVTGPRLLAGERGLKETLLSSMIHLCKRHGASSLHVTFPTEGECDLMGEAGLMRRLGQQYHWENRGYGDFDDFLATLSSRKRKTIRKERQVANSHGVRLETLTGEDIKPHHWDAFYKFYRSTTDRKWGRSAYLTPEFFHRLGETMAEKVVLVHGEMDGEPLCGALNLLGGDTLYGRNWGALRPFRHLHFEACYYRAMDFAIERGLKWVEAGAQGEHKISRGYLPRATHSAHWIADPALALPVERFLEEERKAVAGDMAWLTECGPYRKER